MSVWVKKVSAMGDRERQQIAEENKHYVLTGEWNRFGEPPAGPMVARIAHLEAENRELKELLEMWQ